MPSNPVDWDDWEIFKAAALGRTIIVEPRVITLPPVTVESFYSYDPQDAVELPHVPLTKTANDISVDVAPHPTESGRHQAVVKDVPRQRAWSGEGGTPSEAVTEATRKFLGDRRTREYLP